MEDIWFEEELVPAEQTVTEQVKKLGTKRLNTPTSRQLGQEARGILRVDRPRWKQLTPEEQQQMLTSGQDARFYLIRLGFQFDVPPENYNKTHWIYGRCSADLWPSELGQPQPTVVEMFPTYLSEGKPQQIHLELGPAFKVGIIEGGIGKLSTDIAVGMVEPTVVGFPGQGSRKPHWDLRPNSKKLVGDHHLWLIIEVLSGCTGIYLSASAQGNVQTRFGPIPIGPRQTERSERYKILMVL